MNYKLAFALAAILTSNAFAAFKAPLPEFKNEKQLAEWRAEQKSKPASQGYATPETAFYTGKPYLATSGSYAFKYRSYSPELARWTSEDPSGFPDGANGNRYAPIPSYGLDFAGLWKLQIVGDQAKNDSNWGLVSIGGFDHRMSSGYYVETQDITATSTNTSGTVNADFFGTINKLNYALERNTQGDVSFAIAVDSTGQISITATGGGYDNVSGNLQIGASWSKEIGNHTATLTFATASMYAGTGLSGTGFQVNGAIIGGGASVSWTNPPGKVSAFTTLSFRAVE